MHICLERSLLRWAILLWMYSRKVRDVHLPVFMIVMSLVPWSLSAMDPPACRECIPIRSGSSPPLWRSRFLTAWHIAHSMS